MNDQDPCTNELSIRQEPVRPGRTRLSLSGQLDVAVANLLLSWTGDICAVPLLDVQLDLRGLTSVDRAGAQALAAAWEYLQLHCRRIDVLGISPEARAAIDALGLAVTGRRVPPGPALTRRVTGGLARADDGTGRKPGAAGEGRGGDCS
jgi:anti-anti-sigma regulatory factor